MKFLRVNDRWINADEIQTVEVRKCYKEKYYIREYYQAVLITKYDSEYILYEHEDKGKVLDYIVLLLIQLNGEAIDNNSVIQETENRVSWSEVSL